MVNYIHPTDFSLIASVLKSLCHFVVKKLWKISVQPATCISTNPFSSFSFFWHLPLLKVWPIAFRSLTNVLSVLPFLCLFSIVYCCLIPFFYTVLSSFFSPSPSPCLQLPRYSLIFFLSPTVFLPPFHLVFRFFFDVLVSAFPLCPQDFTPRHRCLQNSRFLALLSSSFPPSLTSYTTTSLPFRLHKMSSHIVIFLVKPFRDFLSRNERWLCLYFRTSFIFFEWPDVIIWTPKPLHQNSWFQAFVLTVSPTPDLNLKASPVK